MMRMLSLGVALVCIGASTMAQAEENPGRDAPPARVGFQMALRTGYAIPMGKANGGTQGDAQ